MRAVILSTGDELTTGRTLDTNAHFIADQLIGIGIDVVGMLVVGDYPERIAWAWRQALSEADVVLCTGGLGPTADDLTTETVAAVAGVPLRLDQAVADRIRQMFAAMGRTMPENNLKQALFPEGATIISNPLGTAPGFRLAIATEHGPVHGIVMPGVPREMKQMLADEVLPWLRTARGGVDEYRSHTFQTFGISESALDELVAGAVDPAEARLAFRAAFPQISVRVTAHGPPGEVDRRLEAAAAALRARIGGYAYGEGNTTMEAEVGKLLTAAKATIAVAESCTGGLIGHRLTDVPGSSAYVLGDVVAYSNAAKQSVLGVRAETLAEHGAVSCETAEEMARGVRRLLGATLGLATTGIAGPDGGTPEKPVGTVCIALDGPHGTRSRRYQLWGTRDWVKLLTSQIALDWVRRVQLGEDPAESAILKR
ncbi:MAG TPA: competence/damage-inducible protein A [Candidatus Dormibacteraeota bacterium]|nr:competence/damage-inducible protein A [Candidatus Dormibacteraeota bacterium]